jgi:hypothetical protein
MLIIIKSELNKVDLDAKTQAITFVLEIFSKKIKSK